MCCALEKKFGFEVSGKPQPFSLRYVIDEHPFAL